MKPAVSLRALILFALVAPVGLALAHQYQQGDPIDQINPGPLGMAEFGKILAGEFNGDHVLDCFVEDAGEPKLVVWPESHKNAHGIGTYANDFDVFHDIVAGRDGLLTVNSDGLTLWVYDEVNDEFDVFGGAPIADATTNWMDALLVRVAEVDGANGKDIVGVAANGNDVLVMLNDGDNTFTAGTGHTNPNDIYDMVVLNWRETGDTAGTDEIATFTPSNWQVREPSGGQILKTTAWSISTIYGCAIDWGSTTQCLVLVARSGGSDWMATYGVGNFVDGPYELGDIQVVSMASGDANNDGRSDVFLSIQAEKKFYMYLQGSAPPIFPYATPTKYAYGPPTRDPALNNAGLAQGDFDGDGFLDIVGPAQGHLTGAITAYGTLVLRQLGYGAPGDLKVGVTGSTYNYLAHPDELSFGLTAPTTVMSVNTGNIAKLRVEVWQTSDLQGVTTPRTALKSEVIDLPTDELSQMFTFELPEGYDPTAGGSYETFSLVARQVEVEEDDETNTVLDEGPALCVLWVPQRHYSALASAADVVTPTSTFSIGVDDPPPGGGSGAGPTVPAPGDGSTPKR